MGPGGVGVAREEIARQLCVRVEDYRGEAMRNRKKERDDKAHGGFLLAVNGPYRDNVRPRIFASLAG